MSNNKEKFDAIIAEFCCPSDQAYEAGNPVTELSGIFKRVNLPFAVEKYRFSKEEILTDSYWKEWRESHTDNIPDELATFVFVCAKKNKPIFYRVYEQWFQDKENHETKKDV